MSFFFELQNSPGLPVGWGRHCLSECKPMEFSQRTRIFLQNVGFVNFNLHNRPAKNWWISCCGSPHFLMLFQVAVRCVWIGNTWWELLQWNIQMIWSSKLDPHTEKNGLHHPRFWCMFYTLAKLTVQDYKILAETHNFPKGFSISSVVTLPMQLHRNGMKFPGAMFIWGSVHSRYTVFVLPCEALFFHPDRFSGASWLVTAVWKGETKKPREIWKTDSQVPWPQTFDWGCTW